MYINIIWTDQIWSTAISPILFHQEEAANVKTSIQSSTHFIYERPDAYACMYVATWAAAWIG